MTTMNRCIPNPHQLKSLPAILSIVLLVAVSSGCLPGSRNMAWESRAKSMLRSMGSSQLAFQGTNPDNSYGTFKALQNSMYIPAGYTLDNMMEGHTMTWEVSSSTAVSTVEKEEVFGFSDVIERDEEDDTVYDEFTIIAFPRDPRELSTFCITEDQVLRVYNPDNGNDIDDVKTWDPIM